MIQYKSKYVLHSVEYPYYTYTYINHCWFQAQSHKYFRQSECIKGSTTIHTIKYVHMHANINWKNITAA